MHGEKANLSMSTVVCISETKNLVNNMQIDIFWNALLFSSHFLRVWLTYNDGKEHCEIV